MSKIRKIKGMINQRTLIVTGALAIFLAIVL